MDEHSTEHRRRPRYRGPNPRAFHERYKEHDPERHGDTIAKVIARGDTPAGSHRAIMVDEVLRVLAPQPGETAVDATLGYGGHARALLRAIQPGGRLIGLDIDPLELPRAEARLRAEGYPDEALTCVPANFAALPKVLAACGLAEVDLLVADLGVSSMQLDDPTRGFTYKQDGPLDLRMNPRRGVPASAMLATLGEAALARMLRDHADEVYAEAIAAVIYARRGDIVTTTDLARAVRDALEGLPAHERVQVGDDAVRRTFQAVRIAVNGELSALDTLLGVLPYCLRPGGRAAILTFHSGEDRRIKRAFQHGLECGVYDDIARTVVRAGGEERHANPRSASAKLRWARRGPGDAPSGL